MKKGFTLAETLAVIAIIAILGLITIPAISKSIEKNRKKVFTETLNNIVEAVKIYRANNDLVDKATYDVVNNAEIEYSQKNKIKSGKVKVNNEAYIIEYITNGEYCAYGIVEHLVIGKKCSDIDNTIPIIASTQLSGRTLTLEMEDDASGIKAYCITDTNDSNSCTWIDTDTNTVEETLTTSGTYYIFAKDNKDNISEAKSFETGDIQDPTIPTSGSIGLVSGSNTTGTIQNPVSGSTDENEITYKYLITNNNIKPNKYDTNFTTDMTFTRSCGKTYYGWAVAEDSNGYRSEVYALGSTQDGTDSYSDWGTCTKACGTGTQTRTNSCQLVTEELSQNCNTQTCCSSTTYKDTNGTWGACSKNCGGGTQSYTVTRTYYSSYDGSYCSQSTGVVTSSRACNTQSCQVATIWDANGTCAGATSCSAGNRSYNFSGSSSYNDSTHQWNGPNTTLAGPSFTMDLTPVKTINYVYSLSASGSQDAYSTIKLTINCGGIANSVSATSYDGSTASQSGTLSVNVTSLTGSKSCSSSINFTGSGANQNYGYFNYGSYSISRIYPTY